MKIIIIFILFLIIVIFFNFFFYISTNKRTMRRYTDDDVKAGTINEQRVLPVINNFFNCKFSHTTDKYNPIDFRCDKEKILVEVKTINNKHDGYYQLMIGNNKIQHALKYIGCDWDFYIVFSCRDGDYIYQLTKDRYDRKNIRKCGRTDRGFNEIKDYYFINNNLLQQIDMNSVLVYE